MIIKTVCVVSDFTEGGGKKDINNYRHIQLHLLYKDKKTVCITDQNLIFIFR